MLPVTRTPLTRKVSALVTLMPVTRAPVTVRPVMLGALAPGDGEAGVAPGGVDDRLLVARPFEADSRRQRHAAAIPPGRHGHHLTGFRAGDQA